MTQITSTRMTRTTTTRASCTSEHGTQSALFRRHTLMAHAPHWLKMFLGLTSLHRHTCVVLLDLTFLPFDLTFTVFFHSSVLMHPEHYTDLDNLDTVQSNLRNSAKGSNDAYDVTHSLTFYFLSF